MKRGLLFLITFLLSVTLFGQQFNFNESSSTGFSVRETKSDRITIDYALSSFNIEHNDVKGITYESIAFPGNFLPAREGNPDLPSQSCFVAIPKGAKVSFSYDKKDAENFKNKNIIPARAIPFDTEEQNGAYIKNAKVYEKNAFYPATPVEVSEVMNVRGVEVVQIGVTPFQYNPVSKELQVITNIEINISLEGSKGSIAEERLRSPWFEPILQDMLTNYDDLPDVKTKPGNTKSSVGYEYLIVIPNDPAWLPYAQQLQAFRNQQGILTGIVTLQEIGGNTPSVIEAYIDNAYNTWDIPPVAVLLMADYGTDATNSINSYELSHPYSGTYITDNLYADVSGNSLPDIIFARMAAENTTQLETMVSKVIEYESNPPADAAFYSSPVTALGWQTERWFQICSEVIGGYMQTQGKTPNRINEIYSGTPGTQWSTATNTSTVVDYFGPNGLGYIPATPDELGNWSGGNATMVSGAINAGTFMVVHRDHGGETLWGEPGYSTSHINALTNTRLPFVFSLNCLTGKFNSSNECFAEAFHRHTFNGNNSGALGLIAASQVSYSFVNDTYAWGMFDNFFPDFMPDYGMTQVQERGLMPAFGNASGKYFLQQSNWPYNSYNKEVTYNLFHHHGDAFSTVYYETPQTLAVSHSNTILSSASSFDVIAPDGALIGLSVNGQMLGSAFSAGGSTTIPINPLNPQDLLIVTVTKQNFYRYQDTVTVSAPAGGCIMYNSHSINDIAFNGNGIAEYGESVNLNMVCENIGDAVSTDVSLSLQTTDSYLTITQAGAFAGTIAAGTTATINDAFSVSIAENTPDGHTAAFVLTATDINNTSWTSNFNVIVSSGELQVHSWSITDAGGDGTLDPGETGTLKVFGLNSGTAMTENVFASVSTTDSYLTINTTTPQSMGNLTAGNTAQAVFEIAAAGNTPTGHQASIDINLTADKGLDVQDIATVYIGKIPALVIDLDPLPSSGTAIQTEIQNAGVNAQYSTTMPSDLNLYKTVFLCLGIYPDNHTLSTDEGQLLADFLNNGGKLYMEGGDTWAYDPATAVHPMFCINGISDGGGDLNYVHGVDNTGTEGMTFNYTGPNSYIDQLEATGNGESILQNPVASYMCGIRCEGTNYKTIGASFEFGGLQANATTPGELMAEYLTFFELTGTTTLPPQITVQPQSISTFIEQCSTETHTITVANTGQENLICTIEQPVVGWMSTSTAGITVLPGTSAYFDITLDGQTVQAGSYSTSLVITSNDPDNGQILFPVDMEVANPVVCPAPYTVCENDLPFALQGGTPAGGVYLGNFISGGIFNPQEAGPGTHEVTYNVTPEGTTCTMTCTFTITVNAAPVVICPEDIALCGDMLEPFALTGASPQGGIYSGPGVTDSVFDPVAAGYGVHTISYTYTDPVSGCYDFDSFTITVDSLQQVSCPGRIDVCENDPEFDLYGGIPAGGYYLYQGDTLTTFSPQIMGPGAYRITYIVPGNGVCGGSCEFTIRVHASPTTPQNYTATQVDEYYMNLSWDASLFVRKYYLFYKEINAADWNILMINKNNTTATIDDLNPGTTYQTMIQATGRLCDSYMSDTLTVTTLESPVYCTTGGLDSNQEWVDYVKIGNLRHNSGNDNGYSDNTALGWGKLYTGRSSRIHFSADRTGAKRNFHWSAWIDFNRDGIFDDNELIASKKSNKTNTLKTTFFIPNDAHIGITRARVSMKYGGYPGACELYDRGETEDYLVKIFKPKNASSGDMIMFTDEEEELIELANLYCVPNPATDYVLVYYGTHVENALLELYNTTGNKVYQNKVSGIEYPMNVSTFTPGVYIVSLTTAEKIITGKLIVK